MRNNFLDDLLVDPLSGEKLYYDESGSSYSTTDRSVIYPVIGSIPQILTARQDNLVPSLHEKFGSVFNYPDHYQKDAILDDYSEKQLPHVTRTELKRLRESVTDEIKGNERTIVLDAGCGNGWVSKKLVPVGIKVISMDISLANPERTLKDQPGKNHAGLVADAFFIPLPDGSVDYVIASEILEHVTNPAALIESLLRVVRPGGRVIITTPYNEKIEYFLCVHCNKPTPKSAHLHSFDELNILKLLPPAGINCRIELLVNRLLSKFRINAILGFLPSSAWRPIDRFFNKIGGEPTRLKIVIEKNS